MCLGCSGLCWFFLPPLASSSRALLLLPFFFFTSCVSNLRAGSWLRRRYAAAESKLADYLVRTQAISPTHPGNCSFLSCFFFPLQFADGGSVQSQCQRGVVRLVRVSLFFLFIDLCADNFVSLLPFVVFFRLPELEGAWFRAFDYDAQEYWGSDNDWGYGCVRPRCLVMQLLASGVAKVSSCMLLRRLGLSSVFSAAAMLAVGVGRPLADYARRFRVHTTACGAPHISY